MRKSMAAVKQAGGAASLLAARKKLKKKKHLMRERKSADIKLVLSISSDSTDYEPSICQRVEITLRKSEDLRAVAYAIAIYFIAAFAGAILGGALTTVLQCPRQRLALWRSDAVRSAAHSSKQCCFKSASRRTSRRRPR